MDRRRLPLLSACSAGSLDEVRSLLELGAPIDAATRRGTTALDVALEAGSIEVAALLGAVEVWQSDTVTSAVEFGGRSSGRRWNRPVPPRVRAAVAASRQLRDLLRPAVDPRAKARRAVLFRESPLLVLPYHVRVHVLRFLVVSPLLGGWGDAEFERE